MEVMMNVDELECDVHLMIKAKKMMKNHSIFLLIHYVVHMIHLNLSKLNSLVKKDFLLSRKILPEKDIHSDQLIL